MNVSGVIFSPSRAKETKKQKKKTTDLRLMQRRSERLPTVHCNRIIRKMAEFSSARGVFSVFFRAIFGGLDS